MEKNKIELVVKTFYEKLEEGIILGRKCKRCGHVEYPPYLACNTCGCLDTEWVEVNKKAMCNLIIPPMPIFAEPEFAQRVGNYWVAAVQTEGGDEVGTSLINIDPKRFDEYYAKLPFPVRAVIVQDVDTKIVLWEPDEGPEDVPDTSAGMTQAAKAAAEYGAGEDAAAEVEMDEAARVVIECAAEAYGVDKADITFDTDIREDLANQSMKMIVMLSGIDDRLDVTIEIPEAGNLNTIGEFIQVVRERLKK